MSPRDVVLLFSLTVALQGERLSLEVYSTAEGLSDNTARPLLASPRGYLWVASGPDLARFDGHSFRIYSAADGWRGGRPLSMIETSAGEFYISTVFGLFRFHPDTPAAQRFTPVALPGPTAEATEIFEDSQHRLWLATDAGAYRRDRGGNWRHLEEIKVSKSFHHTRVEHFAEDHLGDVWLTAYSGTYCYRRDGSVERYSRDDYPQMNDTGIPILTGPDHKVYVGTEAGLFRFARPDPGRRAVVDRMWTIRDGLPSLYVAALAFWKGELWVGTIRGLTRIDHRGRAEVHTEVGGAKEPAVEMLMKDQAGSLWVGTDGAGIMQGVNRGFTNFGEKDGLAFPHIEQTFEDRTGNLIAVSRGERRLVLNRWSGEGDFSAYQPPFPRGLAFPWAWSQIALHSRAGDWWFSSNAGPIGFRAASMDELLRTAPLPNPGAPRGHVFRLFEDSRGGIWVSIAGSRGRLGYRNPATREWRTLAEPDGFRTEFDNEIASFAEDRAGNIWMTRTARGVYRFRDGRLRRIEGPPELNQAPRELHLDDLGRLWIATKRAGILRVDDPSAERPAFQRYQISQGLSSNATSCLTSDRHGNIYVCTGRGIDRLQPSTGQIRTYTSADGLLGGSYRHAYRDRQGALWFGTTEGVSRFQPPTSFVSPSPRVVIQGLRVAQRTVPVPAFGIRQVNRFRIEPHEQRLQVDYVAFDPRARYQHRLVGVNEWSAPGSERTILLEGLSSGNYRFEVRAISSDGALSHPASVDFHVVPPFWLRWWFLLLGAAALCAGAYRLHRYRIQQLLALEHMRLRIAADLHDDIGSSLSQVSMLGELARRSLNGSNPAAGELIDRMAATSREAVASMGDIVWTIHPRNGGLGDLVKRMRSFAVDVLSARGMEFDFDAPAQEQELSLPLDVRRDLLLIFKESVNNAARHSGGRSVRVGLRCTGAGVLLTVEDDGRGFDLDRVSPGQGLGTMCARAKRLGGRCEVHATPGGGTRLRVTMPLKEHV